MKKTATLIAIAGLSMAAKTEHSFLGKKPVEIKAEIDPKMIIKPAHDIDPGMVRKPNRNIDQGMIVKPKKTQGAILTADDNDDELLSIYRPLYNIDPYMVIKPRDDIDQGMIVKPKKTTGTILTADDNDDELLLIYRPADNIDPGMVRRPPAGYDIDPKFVIKPPRGFDDGIFVRPRTRTEPVWVDDEMRLVNGNEVDPGFVIKPKRGDIDPGMVRKPVKGREIDPKIFVKPRRGDVLYADDDELTVFGHVREPREKRLVGDFPTGPWPGKPVYADAEDDEFCLAPRDIGSVSVSDPIIHPPKRDDESEQMTEMVREPRYVAEHGKSADDELVYASTRFADPEQAVHRRTFMDIDQAIIKRPGGNIRFFDAENDDELAVVAEKSKQVREPRMIGDFYTKPWPGQPVYADAEDDELIMIGQVSDQGIPVKHDDELYYGGIRGFQVSNDDELYYGGIRGFETAHAVNDLAFSARPMSLKRDDDYELASFRPIRVQTQHHDDEAVAQMTEMVREPRYIGEHGKSADDELVYALSRIDPGMVRRPPFENIDQGMIRRPRSDIKYFDAENDDEFASSSTLIGDLQTVSRIHHPKPPVKPIIAADDANDDELIMFADNSLGKPRRGVFDPRELTKPWYQQQETMYADDADNELLWVRKAAEGDHRGEKPHSQKPKNLKAEPKKIQIPPFKVNDLKTGRVAASLKPTNKTVQEADDELIMFADARVEKRRVPVDLKELTKPWYEQRHTMYADDADNELANFGRVGPKTIEKNRTKLSSKPVNEADDADNELAMLTKKKFESNPKAPMVSAHKPVHKPVQEADDELTVFVDRSLDARLEKKVPQQKHADDADNELARLGKHKLDSPYTAPPQMNVKSVQVADDDSLVVLAELLEDN